MKILGPTPLTNKFLAACIPDLPAGGTGEARLLGTLVAGLVVQEKPSPNKIHDELVTGASKRTFYREIHALAGEMPGLFAQFQQNFQRDARVGLRPDGFFSLDEHIIPHGSDGIEGTAYFYSTTANGQVLGQSVITVHYCRGAVEYPVAFEYYRRKEELARWGKDALYRPKNAIARDILERVLSAPNAPELVLFDSYFMCRENCQLLARLGRTYISRPKRSWACTYQGKRQGLGDLFEAIPPGEFKEITVQNPKTGRWRKFTVATRDAFFKNLGTLRVVFIDCSDEKADAELAQQEGDPDEAPSGRRYRVFITNELAWPAEEILGLYSVRWTIETSYRDMSQNLGLHGCKWRELSGQYCFIALSFLAYAFLTWAAARGLLDRYAPELRTLGQKKTAFIHYCQDTFATWLAEIRGRCGTCPAADWINEHVFSGVTG